MWHAKYDVTGKLVHLGIDAHLANLQICAVCEGAKLANFSYPAHDVAGLIARLRKMFPEARFSAAYEAGFSGFTLQRQLSAAGIPTIVVNPGSIPVEGRRTVKTDKIDALKIATLLYRGLLKGIRIPTPEQEQRRELTRTRQQLVDSRKRIGNQIKMKLHYHGSWGGKKLPAMSAAFLDELLEMPLPQDLKTVISSLAAIWRELARQIKELEKQFCDEAKGSSSTKTSEKHRRTLAIYRSAPGIGDLSAHIFANELGDMSQFANERQLSSWCGLTPSEYSSGEKRHQGHITRQGTSRIRHIMTEVSWRAIRQDTHLRLIYERIAARRGGKRAILAVARRMLGHIRSCLLNDVEYRVSRGADPETA